MSIIIVRLNLLKLMDLLFGHRVYSMAFLLGIWFILTFKQRANCIKICLVKQLQLSREL